MPPGPKAPDLSADREKLGAIDRALAAKGVLRADAPQIWARREEVAASLGRGEPRTAELEALSEQIGKLPIDRAFVDRKIARLSAKLATLSAADQQRLRTESQQALSLTADRRYDEANRHLNAIAASEPGAAASLAPTVAASGPAAAASVAFTAASRSATLASGGSGTHTPARQVPPGHDVPSLFSGFEKMPVVGSHVPAAWHESGLAKTWGLEPVHVPVWHVSVCVQASPSSQAVPLTGPQVPSTAAPASTEHAWQSFAVPSPQAASQHTPSTHKPLPHWLSRPHALPLASLAIRSGCAALGTPFTTTRAQNQPGARSPGSVAVRLVAEKAVTGAQACASLSSRERNTSGQLAGEDWELPLEPSETPVKRVPVRSIAVPGMTAAMGPERVGVQLGEAPRPSS